MVNEELSYIRCVTLQLVLYTFNSNLSGMDTCSVHHSYVNAFILVLNFPD